MTNRLGVLTDVQVRWRRGFVDRITTGMLNYLDHAGRLARYAPAVELVLVVDDRDGAEMEGLDYDEQVAVFERFSACPHLTSCVTLDLSRICPGIEGLELILRSPHLTNLALLYSTGELDEIEAADFERRLAEDQAARDALCQAVIASEDLVVSC